MTAAELIAQLQEVAPNTPVFVWAGFGDDKDEIYSEPELERCALVSCEDGAREAYENDKGPFAALRLS